MHLQLRIAVSFTKVLRSSALDDHEQVSSNSIYREDLMVPQMLNTLCASAMRLSPYKLRIAKQNDLECPIHSGTALVAWLGATIMLNSKTRPSSVRQA